MFYVYKIVNKTNGKYYVGRTNDIETRKYRHFSKLRNNKHHCRYLQNSYNKYGDNSFEMVVVETFENLQECIEKEQWYLDNLKHSLYNRSESAYGGGDNISNHPERDKIIKKQSEAVKRWYSSLSKQELHDLRALYGERNGMYDKTHSPEARNKIKKKLRKHYENNSNYRKGKKYDELFDNETANRLRQKLSHNASQRTGEKNPFYGKTHSEETRRKISNSRKGIKPANQRMVIVDETEYPSVTEASRQLGVSPATIIHRIKSENPKYRGYFYKENITV